MYAIRWKSKITGKTGFGEYILSYNTANNLRNLLNQKHTEIEHWIEEEDK